MPESAEPPGHRGPTECLSGPVSIVDTLWPMWIGLVLDRPFLLLFRWAFYTDYGCEERVVKMMQTAVKGFWATTASSLMTIALILSPGKVKAKKCENLETSESVISATRKTWNQR